MFALLEFTFRLILPSVILLCFFSTQAEAVYSKSFEESNNLDLRKPHNFSILACVTCWSHDAAGYHPSMCLFLENISGHSIPSQAGSNSGPTDEEIPFQGRFTDIRTGEVTVAREYRRAPIRNHERFPVFLRGPQSYDLPIDSSLWPSIECKAMCRINDTEPEDLFIGRLAHITMSDEDAQATLVAQAGRSPLLIKGNPQDKGKLARLQTADGINVPQAPDIKNLPLRAKQSTFSGANEGNHSPMGHPSSNTTTKKLVSNAIPKSLPAIGDDFYAFEKLYGPATEFQTSTAAGDLTWTHYKASGLITEVFVGSRNASKADVIILNLSSDPKFKEKDILSLGKQLARSSKSDPITPFSHSVRYSPTGRFEFMTTAIRECRILSFRLSNGTILAVSRLPGDIETGISNYSNRVNFLNFMGL